MEQEGNKPENQEEVGKAPDPVTVTPDPAPDSVADTPTQWPLTGDSFDIGIPYYQPKQGSLDPAAQANELLRNRVNDSDYQQAAQEALRNRELSPETYRNMFPNDTETLGRMQSWGGLKDQIKTQKEPSINEDLEYMHKSAEGTFSGNMFPYNSNPLPKVRNPLTPIRFVSPRVNEELLKIELRLAHENNSRLNRSFNISLVIIFVISLYLGYELYTNKQLSYNLESVSQDNSFLKSHNKFLHEQLDAANVEIFKLTQKEQKDAIK